MVHPMPDKDKATDNKLDPPRNGEADRNVASCSSSLQAQGNASHVKRSRENAHSQSEFDSAEEKSSPDPKRRRTEEGNSGDSADSAGMASIYRPWGDATPSSSVNSNGSPGLGLDRSQSAPEARAPPSKQEPRRARGSDGSNGVELSKTAPPVCQQDSASLERSAWEAFTNSDSRSCSFGGLGSLRFPADDVDGNGHMDHRGEDEKRRVDVNKRERERMHELNSAMDKLRDALPNTGDRATKKFSKLNTLLLAANTVEYQRHVIEKLIRERDHLQASLVSGSSHQLSTPLPGSYVSYPASVPVAHGSSLPVGPLTLQSLYPSVPSLSPSGFPVVGFTSLSQSCPSLYGLSPLPPSRSQISGIPDVDPLTLRRLDRSAYTTDLASSGQSPLPYYSSLAKHNFRPLTAPPSGSTPVPAVVPPGSQPTSPLASARRNASPTSPVPSQRLASNGDKDGGDCLPVIGVL